MSEGEQLQRFIDNQTLPKIRIAEALGMSRQNLFQIFKSKVLALETKKKFEDFFGKTIFTLEPQDSYKKPTRIKSGHETEIVQLLKDKISYLERENARLENDCNNNFTETRKMLTTLLENSEINKDFLKVVMAQIKAASRVAAERWSEGNQKRLSAALNTLDNYVGEFLNDAY